MADSDETLRVLREIWDAGGRSSEDVEEACGPQKACKNMQAVGFDGLTSSWRDQLAADGKLDAGASPVRDLVLGPDRQP
ncbi:hypothetical protein Amsp01_038630 [Amycolatopsis sp. NBRC 101858]|uniref:hypothetical protein n=1 Tax=Amycolatopsis sp. NBRC 101858 TaxID=3032200 RepID=UPI0024A115EB|nr:hypothetical protein [Amycolatopsis sp. NBRC 101858]GLY37839.1 hypothetical protein Amsp01_038630 [Amycolatopsis sp. NBRC 101858]